MSGKLRPFSGVLPLTIAAAAVAISVQHGEGLAKSSPDDASCRVAGEPGQPPAGSVLECVERSSRQRRDQRSARTVLVRDDRPYLGESCLNLYAHPAVVVVDPGGDPDAVFTLAGGATSGRLPLSQDDVRLAATHDGYVIDAQLGSYEELGGRLVCRLSPTFHFYCPDTDALDRACITWVARPTPSGAAGPWQR
jgi:hypothetical protein